MGYTTLSANSQVESLTPTPSGVPIDTGQGGSQGGSNTTVQDTSNWISDVVKFVASLGGLVKQGTQHMPWDKANSEADVFGDVTVTTLNKNYSSSDALKIAQAYRVRMLAYLRSTNRWGEGYPQNKQDIINGIQNFTVVNVQGARSVTWQWAMWALQNTDLGRPNDFFTVTNFDMAQTLYKAVQDVTGKNPSSYVFTDLGTTGTGSGSGSMGAGTTLNTTLASFTSNPLTMLLLVGAVVGVIFFTHKGGA